MSLISKEESVKKEELPPFLYLSNQIEVLLKKLRENLFSSSVPFEKKIVVVPSLQLKPYLLFHLSKNSPSEEVGAGFQVLKIEDALLKLLGILYKSKKTFLPSSLEISFFLEQEIFSLAKRISCMSLEEKEIFSPLLQYLKIEKVEDLEDKKVRKRMAQFAQELGISFTQYVFHGENFLTEWEGIKGWQQALYQALVSSSSWFFPSKQEGMQNFFPFPIHIWGFSFFPKSYVSFFRSVKTQYYFLSPCQFFWGDLKSEKERIFFHFSLNKSKVSEEKREELDSYLKDPNPLLANWGKMGRKFLSFLEEKDAIMEEEYEEEETSLASNILHLVQQDILLLRNGSLFPPASFSSDDASIQLHEASSKWREVEILFDSLCAILQKHKEDEHPLFPGSIVVMAPNIEEYAPFIDAVFGFQRDILDYSISDEELFSQSSFAQALHHLVSLPEMSFSEEAVFKLLYFPCFMKKFSLSREDIALIQKWVKKAPAYSASPFKEGAMGREGEHWEQRFHLFLNNLAYFLTEEEGVYPFSNYVGMQELELLGKFIFIVRSLLLDLKYIEEDASFSISQWIFYLECLARAYFSLGGEEEEVLQKLKKAAFSLKCIEEPIFGFSSVKRILEKVFKEKKENLFFPSLRKIQFCSLKEGSFSAREVVCLLGMEEESYPLPEEKSSLWDSSFFKKDYFPSKKEEGQYFFLQAILMARKYLLLSYSSLGKEDKKRQNLSSLVQELFSYLDKSCISTEGRLPSESLKKTHPLFPLDKSYFTKDASFKGSSFLHFLGAQAQDTKNRCSFAPFISDFYTPQATLKQKTSEEKECIIDIKDLAKLARNPLQFYFNRSLKIFFKSSSDEEEREFVLSSLDKTLLRTASFTLPIDKLFSHADVRGKLPRGVFKKAAYHGLSDAIEEEKEDLAALEVEPQTVFSIEMSRSYLEPKLLSEKKWGFPPLRISLPHERAALIVGKIEGITSQGLLYRGQNSLKDCLKAWPIFLVFLHLFSFAGSSSCLLLTKGKSQKTLLSSFDPSLLLSDYICYYEKAQGAVSPLFPEWGEALLSTGEKDLERVIKDSWEKRYSLFEDPYLAWLSSRDPLPSAEAIMQNWGAYFRELFSPLLLSFFKDE